MKIDRIEKNERIHIGGMIKDLTETHLRFAVLSHDYRWLRQCVATRLYLSEDLQVRVTSRAHIARIYKYVTGHLRAGLHAEQRSE